MKKITLSSWNIYATRFVHAPALQWEPVPAARIYRVRVADAGSVLVRQDTPVPEFGFSEYWDRLPFGPLDLLIEGLNADGNEAAAAFSKRIYKVPGYDGAVQKPLDWLGAICRNLDYLLAPARDGVKPFEAGLPRSCWSSYEESTTGMRYHFSYPALHHPSFIFCYLAAAESPHGFPQAEEARRQAASYADWLLENRHPMDAKCALFPYSTIHDGKLEGGNEGRNITVFRAARVAEAMAAIFRSTGKKCYLEYARHLADKLAELQNSDGSWPYRMNPETGEVTELYTSNVVTPARLFGLLNTMEPTAAYESARNRAAAWMMENPVQNRLWQGMYEDVRTMRPYRNLQNWDVNEAIRYLAWFHSGSPEHTRIAEELNAFIEDQFVVWQDEDSPVPVRCPTPTVLEQYACYYPMEIHTGHWLLSLMELHRITGKPDYLSKAVAAANSIVRGQQSHGAFSTWGSDRRFGRPSVTRDWPGCNAFASSALIQFAAYHRALQEGGKPVPAWIGA